MSIVKTRIYRDPTSMEEVKVGDSIWYRDEDSCDEGVVNEIDGDKVWAKWVNTEISEFVLIYPDYKVYTCGKIDELETETEDRHPLYDVILRWASGGKIQTRYRGVEWRDWDYNFDVTPDFYAVKFRIKPKITKYRLGLNNKGEITVYYKPPEINDESFTKWIDADWKELEVFGD